MFLKKKNRPRERFYLLPGQGGRNYHRKQQYILRWSIALAVFFGAILAVVMWAMSKPKP
ncbi:MAG: hypothetical protein P4N60_22675 [Verrucomicrobiae bacterium]|nr:hypothetical protein [Verrucomicrobiae bacterium]